MIQEEQIITKIDEIQGMLAKLTVLDALFEGGAGSGHWGHKGRKGKKGGSVGGGGKAFRPADYKNRLGTITTGLETKTDAINIRLDYEKADVASYGTDVVPSQLKNVVAERLGEKMDGLNMPEWKVFAEGLSMEGDSKSAAAELIRGWAATSGDTNPRSIMMQLAAQKEFGLDGASVWWKKDALSKAKELLARYEKPARAFIREMYNDTQEHLAKQGLKTVRVARGYAGDIGITPSTTETPIAKTKIKLQPMSSFTGNLQVARTFATRSSYANVSVLYAKIPASRILSSSYTGFGCNSEREFVVLGSRKHGGETMLASMLTKKEIGRPNHWGRLYGSKSLSRGQLDNFTFKKMLNVK